ncbi:hypothetical protein ACJD0Z_11860 [Flavobacteriaceae bacterium M23B6Z8]
MGAGSALDSVVSMRNNKRKRIDRSGRIEKYTGKYSTDKPVYETISEEELAALRKKLKAQQARRTRRNYWVITVISILTISILYLILTQI